MGSLAAVTGTLLALASRDRHAAFTGTRVDVSLQEAASMATVQTANANAYTWNKQIPSRRGLTTGAGGRSLYQSKDGKWLSFVIPPGFWAAFVGWLDELGVPHEVSDPVWEGQAYRTQNPEPVAAATQALTTSRDRDYLFHEGQKRRLLVMPVNDIGDLVHDRQLQERGFFVDISWDGAPQRLVDSGVGYRFSTTPASIRRPAPRLGEHNSEVFGGLLGLSDEKQQRLREAGAV
jgi:crotonobetainyl-CoA:carnitine CoA-transferase CaiB-like acyl-CoA transferase